MKVLLVMPTFPKLSESFIVGKFLALIRRGWDAHVLCSKSDKSEMEKFPELASVRDLHARVHLDRAHKPLWKVALLYPSAVFNGLRYNPSGVFSYVRQMVPQGASTLCRKFYLDSKVLELKPDLVHFEFGATAVGREHLRRALGCPVVASFRGYDINLSGLSQSDYYDTLWSNVSSVHFLGQALRSRAIERGFSPGSSHVLIPPSIDTQFFSPKSDLQVPSNRTLRVLSVGRMTWEKGYEHALESIALARERGVDVEYRVIGDGPLFEGLCFHRHRLGLGTCVHFLGALDRTRVRDEMNQADVFLHSSVSEGFCNSVMEAQAMELPVVCTDAGGLPENVEDGVTACVVPRRNIMAMAQALEKFAMDPGLRTKFGRAGRLRVVQRFDLESRVVQFEEWYQKVCFEEARGGGSR